MLKIILKFLRELRGLKNLIECQECGQWNDTESNSYCLNCEVKVLKKSELPPKEDPAPKMEDYGWEWSTTFEGESGWTDKSGEKAYWKAQREWLLRSIKDKT